MDKVLSIRIDERVARLVGALARKLGTSKKAVIERAVCQLAVSLEGNEELDPFTTTSGAWERDEAPAETVDRSRGAFREGLERNRR